MAPRAHPTSEDRNWRRRHRRGGSRTGGSMIGLRLRELEINFGRGTAAGDCLQTIAAPTTR